MSDTIVMFALSLLLVAATSWLNFSSVWESMDLEKDRLLTWSLFLSSCAGSGFLFRLIFAQKTKRIIKRLKLLGNLFVLAVSAFCSYSSLKYGLIFPGLVIWIIPLFLLSLTYIKKKSNQSVELTAFRCAEKP